MTRNPAKTLMILAFGALLSCHRGPKQGAFYIDRISLSDSTLADNPSLQVTTDELKKDLVAALERSGRFIPVAESDQAPKEITPFHCRLEVAFTKESQEPQTPGTLKAEVGVSMELKRVGPGVRYEATGLGRHTFAESDKDARGKAFKSALEQALSQAVEAELLQLTAEQKDDAALIADLKAQDPRVRDYAVRVLTDRKNPAAVPALIERLNDTDHEVAMRAIGALRTIGDRRAVPALIELTKNKDPQFVVSIIEVVAGIGGDDANAWLFTMASGHPEEQIRQAAQEAQKRSEERAAGTTDERAPAVSGATSGSPSGGNEKP